MVERRRGAAFPHVAVAPVPELGAGESAGVSGGEDEEHSLALKSVGEPI